MKITTVLGTRPEIIRLSRIIPKLDELCDHTFVYTGQNYDPQLSDVFFQQLQVRAPDHSLGVRGASFGEQVAQILTRVEEVLRNDRPERLLILGDTNSGLAAYIAKRMGIPVYHMEAGNRCFDDRVPEEVNRRVIDHCSDVLMPYTERSRANLLREGVASNRVFVTGNPILEVLEHYRAQTEASTVHATLGVEKQHYFLVTMHRAENVDIEARLRAMTAALTRLATDYSRCVLCSLHPRTRSKMQVFGMPIDGGQIRFLEPLGFFDFVALEREAFCVLSDSGTVQEECCLFRVPNVTLRDVTERPETVECGSNILAGTEPEAICRAVAAATRSPCTWTPPREYMESDVSSTVVKIVLGLGL